MKKKYYAWQTLFYGMLPAVMEQFRQHNLLYPTKQEWRCALRKIDRSGMVSLASLGAPAFSRGYPGRIKDSEQETAINILKLWCKETATQINRGSKFITNQVHVNRHNARDGKADPSGTDRHLGKLVYCGFLLGTETDDDSPAVYRSQFEGKGKGYGAQPIKHFNGRHADYVLLLQPFLINQGNLPQGVQFKPLASFTRDSVVHFPAPILDSRIPAHFAAFSPQFENFRPSTSDGNLINKIIRDKVSEIGGKLPESEAESSGIKRESAISDTLSADELADGNHPKAEVGKTEFQAESAGIAENSANILPKTDEIEGSGPVADLVKSIEITSESAFRTLFMAGQEITAFAVLLVQSYLNKLAPAMGRTYYQAESKRAILAAIRLLRLWPEDRISYATDRLILTIDHMAGWIQQNPGKNFVLPPSRWFDPDEKANIIGAEKRFLRKYEETAQSWTLATTLKSAEIAQREEDEKLRLRSDFHAIAVYLKKMMLSHHKYDQRIRMASIEKWVIPLQLLASKDHRTITEIFKVAKWLMCNRSKNAQFWRKDAANLGIRSTTGFRKHFQSMYDQMMLEELRKVKRDELPGSKRLPRGKYA
ncbi:MAG: hypothetical protein AAF206_16150 [Bacteroidota bacterium]